MPSKPYRGNIQTITESETAYRRVLFTTPQMQLVTMALDPHEEIGMESHSRTTQFIRVEAGSGQAIISGHKYILSDGVAVMIPAGCRHNIIAGSKGLKLYTLYSPPEHPDGLVEHQKEN